MTRLAPAMSLARLRHEAALAGLRVRATAAWPAGEEGGPPPAIPGFVASSFSPLVADVGHRCLGEHYGRPPAPPREGSRTAIVIASRYGDVRSAGAVRQAVEQGERVGPLMFYQSVPNAVAGHLAALWGLGGPVVCLSPSAEPMAQAVAAVALLLGDGDADEALLVLVEQGGGAGGDRDQALAALVCGTP
jgi:Beta-ketoacyl synthase, N-terminal domain